MEVAYLLTAEIPSEFHCAQITTFHMQHVVRKLKKLRTLLKKHFLIVKLWSIKQHQTYLTE